MNRVHEFLTQGIVRVNDFLISTDTGSIMSGMESAKNEFMNVVRFAVNVIAVPILAVVVGVFMLFQIAACVKRHNGQQSYGDKLTVVIICVVVLVLIVTFPIWGWQMLGVSSTSTSAAAFLGGLY